MACPVAMKLTLLAFLCVVAVIPTAQAITCNQVKSALSPCLIFLKSGGAVPPACCGGVRTLDNMAMTTPDRQTACNCLKQATAIPGLKLDIAVRLPSICGAKIPYNISTSTNCAT